MKLNKDIKQRLLKQKRVIVAIDGPCASGKSIFAEALKEEFNASLFHMDDYFLPEELKTKERMNEIGGNVDYKRFEEEVLGHLFDESISYQKYDCQIGSLKKEELVNLKEVIIIEGAYSLRPELRKYYDIKILLEIDSETQLVRLEKRNKNLLHRFINEWIPLENRYFKKEELENFSDYIINTKNSK